MTQIEWWNRDLNWNPKDFNGLKMIKSNDILVPDLHLIKSFSNYGGIYKFNATKNFKTKLILYSDGWNRIELNLTLDVKCDSSLYYFPFDKKICTVRFINSRAIFEDVSIYFIKLPHFLA